MGGGGTNHYCLCLCHHYCDLDYQTVMRVLSINNSAMDEEGLYVDGCVNVEFQTYLVDWKNHLVDWKKHLVDYEKMLHVCGTC